MIIFFVVNLTFLPFHFQNLGKIKNYRKEYKDPMLQLSLIINIYSIFGGGITFGRPYSIIIICFIGLITVLAIYIKLTGSVNWTDRLFSLISALAVNAEGIYVYVRYLVRSHKIEDAKYIIYFTVAILAVTFYLWYVLL